MLTACSVRRCLFLLMITPNTLYGRVGAILSALIVVACFIGFTLHHSVYAGIPRRDFFWYYTNLSNLLVALYFSFGAPFFYAHPPLRRFIPLTEFSVTMAIMLTHAVFHLIIYPGVRQQVRCAMRCVKNKMLAANNLMVHYVVPLLVLLYYLLCSPGKHTVSFLAAPLWLLFPLLYLLVIFVHAGMGRVIPGDERRYPYPFIDVQLLGLRRVILSCSVLFLISVAASVSLLCILRGLYAVFGGSKPLILVG